MTSDVRRLGRPRWSDLRLWIGVGLLVGSMITGAAILSRGGDSVVVLRAARDLSAGASAVESEPVAVSASLAHADYATPADVIGEGRTLRWPVPAGQLIPRAALADATNADRRRVTVPLDPIRMPSGLSTGDVVDVWATPKSSSDTVAAVPSLVLSAVTVADLSADNSSMSGELGVVLDVDSSEVAALVTASRSGVIDLAAVPITAQSAR